MGPAQFGVPFVAGQIIGVLQLEMAVRQQTAGFDAHHRSLFAVFQVGNAGEKMDTLYNRITYT